jgi:hypothetical protein
MPSTHVSLHYHIVFSTKDLDFRSSIPTGACGSTRFSAVPYATSAASLLKSEALPTTFISSQD